MSVSVQKDRIEFIDAMRGFTMLLVVFSHVLTISFKSNPNFSFNEIFISFRMPLFFFLSGFLCYKSGKFSQIKGILEFVKKKFIVQIIPTVIFITIYAFLFQSSLGEMWLHTYKGGYWFTFVLFFYFLFFVISFVISNITKKRKLKVLIIGGGGLLIYMLSLFSVHSYCPWKGSWISGFFSIPLYKYYIFFLFGVFVKWQYERFNSLLVRKWFLTSCIILFFVLQTLSCLMADLGGLVWQLRGSIIKPILGFLGVIIVFACFKQYKNSFTNNTFVGRGLQYIGQRTLDIYLLHYFLLPKNLSMLGDFFMLYNNPIVELIVGLFFALLIVGFCLVISNVIRTSDVLAKALFGKVISKG
ncbi:MAG: acyltransferase [Bacteroidaceae bacterium]|nr:acyltransferase [Bacteroidaceae bacterium]